MTMKLDLTHSGFPDQRWVDIAFQPNWSVEQTFAKISNHTGSSPDTIKVEILDRHNTKLGFLDKPGRTLAEHGVVNGYCLHIHDTDPNSVINQLQRTQLEGEVPKFELSDEQYNQRKGTAREFLKSLREAKPELFQAKTVKISADQILAAKMEAYGNKELPQRAQIRGTQIRGELLWVGALTPEEASSMCLGVQISQAPDVVYAGMSFDDEVGVFEKCAYFTALGPKRGAMIPLRDLEVGPEFKPLTIDELDEL